MFDYLRCYVLGSDESDVLFNTFEFVSAEEIAQAENILGRPFPEELKRFYIEIGSGTLQAPYNRPDNYEFYSTNEILPPLVVARFAKGILSWGGQRHWMAKDTLELLEPGDLPFFEIGDSSSFMVMKLYSENPNAVWSDCGVKIEDSFERFIWRLYYESPEYYGDIIESHYAALEEKAR